MTSAVGLVSHAEALKCGTRRKVPSPLTTLLFFLYDLQPSNSLSAAFK
jgi:hypothetical protein